MDGYSEVSPELSAWWWWCKCICCCCTVAWGCIVLVTVAFEHAERNRKRTLERQQLERFHPPGMRPPPRLPDFAWALVAYRLVLFECDGLEDGVSAWCCALAVKALARLARVDKQLYQVIRTHADESWRLVAACHFGTQTLSLSTAWRLSAFIGINTLTCNIDVTELLCRPTPRLLSHIDGVAVAASQAQQGSTHRWLAHCLRDSSIGKKSILSVPPNCRVLQTSAYDRTVVALCTNGTLLVWCLDLCDGASALPIVVSDAVRAFHGDPLVVAPAAGSDRTVHIIAGGEQTLVYTYEQGARTISHPARLPMGTFVYQSDVVQMGVVFALDWDADTQGGEKVNLEVTQLRSCTSLSLPIWGRDVKGNNGGLAVPDEGPFGSGLEAQSDEELVQRCRYWTESHLYACPVRTSSDGVVHFYVIVVHANALHLKDHQRRVVLIFSVSSCGATGILTGTLLVRTTIPVARGERVFITLSSVELPLLQSDDVLLSYDRHTRRYEQLHEVCMDRALRTASYLAALLSMRSFLSARTVDCTETEPPEEELRLHTNAHGNQVCETWQGPLSIQQGQLVCQGGHALEIVPRSSVLNGSCLEVTHLDYRFRRHGGNEEKCGNGEIMADRGHKD